MQVTVRSGRGSDIRGEEANGGVGLGGGRPFNGAPRRVPPPRLLRGGSSSGWPILVVVGIVDAAFGACRGAKEGMAGLLVVRAGGWRGAKGGMAALDKI